MRLPYMKSAGNRTKRQIVAFGGINYGSDTRDGELSESKNLSSARFPFLSQRSGRMTVREYDAPTGLYARGKLCIVDGTSFLYDGRAVGTVKEGEKQFATINSKIVIFPDKAFYDTESGEFGSLTAEMTIYGDAAFTKNTLELTRTSTYLDTEEDESSVAEIGASETVTVYTSVSIDKATGTVTATGETAKTPDAIAEGDILRRGCGEKQYMKVLGSHASESSYFIEYMMHTAKPHTYAGMEELFKAGDAVEISGCTTYADNNGSHIIREVSGNTLTFTENIFSAAGNEAGTVKIERKVPDLTCVCECDNRIWGAEGRTIYASALGDPTNFFVYDGLSTDSYAVAVGTEGDFTGCIAYSSTVLFWKENYVHRVLGNYPAQYEVYTYTVPGVQAGGEKSLCVINETLIYKGRNGVYAYSGGTPELISENFGERRFFEAVAGSDGQRYYISMKDERGDWSLYVYDTLQGLWMREDDTHAADFAYLDGYLYFMDGENGKLVKISHDETEEGPIGWSATLCRMDEATHGKKGYSKLYLRADLAPGAWMKAEISTDGSPFRQVFASHDEHARTVQIPILPMRCDNFSVRLSGKGACIIKSLVREFSVGSEY